MWSSFVRQVTEQDLSSDDEEFPELQDLLKSLPSKAISTRVDSSQKLEAESMLTSSAVQQATDSDANHALDAKSEVPDSTESFKSAKSRLTNHWYSEQSSPSNRHFRRGFENSALREHEQGSNIPASSTSGTWDETGLGIALEILQLPSSPQSSPRLTTVLELNNTIQKSIEPDASVQCDYSTPDNGRELLNFRLSNDAALENKSGRPTRKQTRRIIVSDDESTDEGQQDAGDIVLTSIRSCKSAEIWSDSQKDDALMVYSPPQRSPNKVYKLPIALLPPSTPRSTSKRLGLPKSPHRESTAAFWDEEENASWIDLHSPRKALLPRSEIAVNRLLPETPQSSSARSPKKSLAQKAIDRSRKLFLSERKMQAETFLEHFIEVICPDLPDRLSHAIQIIWSKTLTSTAGRATYSKNKTAKVELSEKVIDCRERLFSTMAHEMCHILVWVIDNQFKNPHGKEFKAFGRKVERLLNISVDTTHDYTIHYKYQWQCINEGCQKIYGRHSKSIDPSKAACGHCHGRLLQILPKPRLAATAIQAATLPSRDSPSKSDGLNKYQTFLRSNIDRIRSANPGLKYAELIKLVAVEYRESKRPDTPVRRRDSMDEALVTQLASMVLSF